MTTFCVSAHKLYDLIVIELASFRSVWKWAKSVLWSPTKPAKGKPHSAVYLLNFPWLDNFRLADLGGHRYIDHKNSPCHVYSVVVFVVVFFNIPTSYLTFGTPSLLILGAAKLFCSSNVFRNFIISQYVHSKASIHICVCTVFSSSPLLIHVCKQYLTVMD